MSVAAIVVVVIVVVVVAVAVAVAVVVASPTAPAHMQSIFLAIRKAIKADQAKSGPSPCAPCSLTMRPRLNS